MQKLHIADTHEHTYSERKICRKINKSNSNQHRYERMDRPYVQRTRIYDTHALWPHLVHKWMCFFFCVFNFSKTCRIVVIHYKRPHISSMAHNTILHARIHFCLRVFGESQDHTMPVKCICDCIIALIESNKTESNHSRRPLRNIRYVATIPAIPFRCHSVWWWQCFLCSNSMRSVSNRTSKLSHIILGRYRTADWEWETWKRQMQSRTIVGCAKHGGEHASRLRPW